MSRSPVRLAVAGAVLVVAILTGQALLRTERGAAAGVVGGRGAAGGFQVTDPNGAARSLPRLPQLTRSPGAASTTAGSLPKLAALSRSPGGRAARAANNALARVGGLTVHLKRAALLRVAPAGRLIARVGRRTGYGARRIFAVGAFTPGWVGVRSLQRPNGRLAWLPEESVTVQPIRTTLVADLSDRQLTIRVDGRVRHRAPIGIGRPGSTTPVGRYGVTDRLEGSGGDGAVYGCCVIPLTGHQPHLPAGWTGGTRVALHGTPDAGSVGQEVSAGCLRMRNADIKRLLPAVPLGATLTVRE